MKGTQTELKVVEVVALCLTDPDITADLVPSRGIVENPPLRRTLATPLDTLCPSQEDAA